MDDGHVDSRRTEFSLGKMIYALCAGALVYVICKSAWAAFFSATMRTDLRQAGVMSNYAYGLLILCFAVPMFGVTLVYARGSSVVQWPVPLTGRTTGHVKSALIGAAAGVCSAVLVAPIISRGAARQWLLAWAVNRGLDLTPVGVGALFLVLVAMPLVSETVFRGIVLRTLTSSASFPAALVASSLLFAYLWPVLSWPAGAVFGLVSGLVYFRTRCLTGPIAANAALTLFAIPAVALYHGLFH